MKSNKTWNKARELEINVAQKPNNYHQNVLIDLHALNLRLDLVQKIQKAKC
jgi:hypothetical protein